MKKKTLKKVKQKEKYNNVQNFPFSFNQDL